MDALWQFMGIPSPSIEAANTVRPLKALPLPRGLVLALEWRGWVAAELPAGAYGVVDRPVPTVAMGTSLGFHAGVPTTDALAITAAICDRVERVRAIHEAASQFEAADACRNPGGRSTSAPSASERGGYYSQRGPGG